MRKPAPRLAFALLLALGASAGRAEEAPPEARGLGLLEVVRLALERDPNVAVLETRLQAARGDLIVAASPFDPELTTTAVQEESRTPDAATQRNLTTTLGLTQLLRTGMSLEPELRLERTRDAGTPGAADNLGTFTLRVRQPLLRGRGRLANAGDEEAGRHDLAATGLEVRHEISLRVLAVATQYWTAAAAVRDLEVLRSSEASARELLETTRRLIEADQVPAAELVQLEANLAAQESATLGGEELLFAARQDLGREIGLEAAAIAALPLPGDPFPQVRWDGPPPAEIQEGWIAAARSRRADLRAVAERRAGADLRWRTAALALRPKLDLILAPSYSGRVEGAGASSYVSPLFRNVPGLSSSLTLDLAWPLLNRRAEGDLVRSAALYDQVARGIDALVPAALDALARDVQRLAKAREAVGLFERAVGNEEKKLRAGTSTLINLISQRDRLTGARQAEVRARLALALSLLRLRFETGTLLAERDGERAEVAADGLTTPPALPSGGTP